MTPTHRLRSAATLLAALALIVGSSPGTAHADWTDAGTTAVNERQGQAKVRAEVLSELNRMRGAAQTCGDEQFAAAPPLGLDTALNNAAYLHATDMAGDDYFDHVSRDGTRFDERITAAGYDWRAAGENIAAGHRNAGAVVADWMASPGHCRNIMNPDFEDLGVGVSYAADSSYGVYWVNNFGQGASTVVDDVVPQAVRAAKPIIEGTAKVGKKLKAKAGAWGPTGVRLTYQWKRDGARIGGATASSYTLVAADRGKRITVMVTGSLAGHSTVGRTSAKTAKVGYGSLKTAKPTISGTAKVGKKLKAKAGAWAPKGVKLTYQWYRAGKKITKATKATYTLGKADKGKRITVKVTGKKSGYTTAAKTSKVTAKVR